MQAAETALCRNLLRLAREGDRQPQRLVPLLRRAPRRYDNYSGRVVRMQSPDSPFSEDVIWEAGGGSLEYAHPGSDSVAARAVRRYLRRARVLGFPFTEADLLLRRFAAASDITGTVAHTVAAGAPPGSAASAAAGASADVAETAQAGADEAIAAGPSLARLPPNSTEEVRAGDLLITHPLSCLFDGPFDQAVVLLTETSEPDLVTGLVLNKPRRSSIDVLLKALPPSGLCDTMRDIDWGPLLEDRLFNGGPVIDKESFANCVHWLHSYGSKVPGSRQLSPGLWLGGDLRTVVELAKKADPAAKGVRFFLGSSSWCPSQLQIELTNGVWVRARPEQASSYAATVALEAPTGPPVWRKAMHSVGMPYFANFPRSRIADKYLQRYFQLYMDEFFRDSSKTGGGSSVAAGSAASKEKAAPNERLPTGQGARKRPRGSGAT